MRQSVRSWGAAYIRRHAFLVSLGIVVILAVIGLMAVVRHLNAPAYGMISPLPTASKTSRQPPKTYSGQHIGFKFPAIYNVSPAPKANSGLLEAVYLVSTDHSDKYVAINVYRGQLANDSGVSYRRAHPDIYKESDSGSSLVFTKNQGGEEYTAFMTHADLTASVSLTTPLNNDLKGDYQTIVGSWQWK